MFTPEVVVSMTVRLIVAWCARFSIPDRLTASPEDRRGDRAAELGPEQHRSMCSTSHLRLVMVDRATCLTLPLAPRSGFAIATGLSY